MLITLLRLYNAIIVRFVKHKCVFNTILYNCKKLKRTLLMFLSVSKLLTKFAYNRLIIQHHVYANIR